MNVFVFLKFVRNIKISDYFLDIYSTGGSQTNLIWKLSGFVTVWCDLEVIANILSLVLVTKNFHVAYGSKKGNTFDVYLKDGTIREFNQSEKGFLLF